MLSADQQMTTQQLTAVIAGLTEQLKAARETSAEKDRTIAELNQNIAGLNETIVELRRMIFGSKSEKTSTMKSTTDANCQQLSIFDCFSECFNEAEAVQDPSVPEPKNEEMVNGYLRAEKGTRKAKATKKELYESLPVIQIKCSYDPESGCPVCGGKMEHLGWKVVREELEIIPAKINRIQYMQETVTCPHCRTHSDRSVILGAETPSPLLPKSSASPSTAAYAMYQKYINAIPLYRQQKDWAQMGVNIQRATLANWIIRCSEEYMVPIYNRLREHLLERTVTCADETPCQVLHEEGRRAQQKSYMWLHCSADLDGLPPISLYEYEPPRAGYNAARFYKDYKGYLICDGYQGYNSLPEGIIRCGCLAHLRRYFYEAIPAEDRRIGKSSSPAATAFNYFNRLFDEDRKLKDLDPETRKARRLELEKPIWDEFWKWLEKVHPVGGSRLAQAVNYAQNQKPYMENYLLDGRIPISNNFAENCARPYAVGRKNFLFHDTVNGANASAVIYSIAQTAKRNNLKIFKYLQMVLLYMPDYKDEPAGIEELMPWSEKVQKECAVK